MVTISFSISDNVFSATNFSTTAEYFLSNWSAPELVDKSGLYFEHRRSLWAHNDLPLNLRKKLSARSLSGAIPLPTFQNDLVFQHTVFISGCVQLNLITAGIRLRIYWMPGRRSSG